MFLRRSDLLALAEGRKTTLLKRDPGPCYGYRSGLLPFGSDFGACVLMIECSPDPAFRCAASCWQ